MTPEQFHKYCKRNKPTRIIPSEYGIVFHFKVRVVIEVSNGIDGLIYTKWRKARKGEGKALLTSLMEATPRYMDELKRKYGGNNNKLLMDILQPKN